MDFLFLLFLPCILWKMKYCKNGFHENFLSVGSTRALRGIMAVLILFHHLCQRLEGVRVMFFLDNVAILCVTAFFFLSGYGLHKSYCEKAGYSSKILRNRIPSVLIPYLGLIAIYWGYSFAEEQPYTLAEVLVSLVNGRPVVSFSWYILAILVLYFSYWISTLLFRPGHLGMLVYHFGFILLWVPFCRSLGWEYYWYYSIIGFPLGILWAAEGQRFMVFLQKRYMRFLIGSFVLFSGLFVAAIKTTVGIDVVVPLFWAACCAFLLFMLLVLMKFSFQNRILLFLGDISFEIYGLQGLFIRLLRSNLCYIENDTLWCFAVSTATVGCAWAMHGLFRKLLSMKKLVQ